jgi:hypothetical protein
VGGKSKGGRGVRDKRMEEEKEEKNKKWQLWYCIGSYKTRWDKIQ